MHKNANNQPTQRPPGYETTDANLRIIVFSAIGLGLVIVFSFYYMAWLFKHDVGRINRARPAPAPLMEYDPMPPEPRLRVDAAKDLAKLRADEEHLLETYEWVDSALGIARIPVARALEIVAQRGLPGVPPPPPAVEKTP
jgi:hypothetical protein